MKNIYAKSITRVAKMKKESWNARGGASESPQLSISLRHFFILKYNIGRIIFR